MKLLQSVQKLSDEIADKQYSSVETRQLFKDLINANWRTIEERHNEGKIKDKFKAFRWALWFSLPQDTKRDILEASGVEYIGGYPSNVNDEHIDTMLRKALPVTKCTKIVVWAK